MQILSKNSAAQCCIMGIDTALRSTGVGVISVNGTSMQAIAGELIRNPSARPRSRCLRHIDHALDKLLQHYRPQAIAIEGIFYCHNVRTAVVLGEARGVVITACARANIPIYEYAPRRVKQSVLGSGAAGKEQVARMIRTLLGLNKNPQSDVADALALAICHAHARGIMGTLISDAI